MTNQDRRRKELEVGCGVRNGGAHGQGDGGGAWRAFSCFVVGTKSSSASAVVAAGGLRRFDSAHRRVKNPSRP